MADTKLSNLTALTAPAAGDFMEILDISDTSMAAAGTNKKMTMANLLAGLSIYSAGGTDVAVADGGTGSSTASAARTALGVAVGSDVQAWDADLDTLSGQYTAWTTWSPTLAGWSSNPASGVYRYTQIGKTVVLKIFQPTNGTSNATTKTITLPVTAATVSGSNFGWRAEAVVTDNGANTLGLGVIVSAGTVIGFGVNYVANVTLGGGFTASGNCKIFDCTIIYEAA